MFRVAAFLILLLHTDFALAQTMVNVNWGGRAKRFTQYVDKNVREQSRRTVDLGKRSEDFQRRAYYYIRELGKRTLVVKDPSVLSK